MVNEDVTKQSILDGQVKDSKEIKGDLDSATSSIGTQFSFGTGKDGKKDSKALQDIDGMTQCLNDQKTLLFEFKAELKFNSSYSRKLVHWNLNEDCCSWEGVECDGVGHVISLELDDEGISSRIENSSTLFSLKYLKRLNLAENDFFGVQIPQMIHNLTHLTHLNLSYANFSGQVPIEISLMRTLVSLDLSSEPLYYPHLRFEIPNLRMLLQNLTELRELYLDRVDISSQRNEWCEIISSSSPNLRKLSLRYCGISGPLDHFLSQIHSLSVLQLDYNNLATTIPNFFANFSSLTNLTLAYCTLKGRFPEMIFQVPTLETLDLSSNELLSGTILQFHQIGSFRTIVLPHTNFSGSLPDSIGNLTMLSHLYLYDCKFTGPIPQSLFRLPLLQQLYLFKNKFISTPFSSNMEVLDLSSNQLEGPIPKFFFKLERLTALSLSHNKFSGRINEVSTPLSSNMEVLDLSSNQLEGPIPKFFFKLERLTQLSLSHNKFSGRVNEVSALCSSNIEELDLRSNQLEGPIPKFFFRLERLEVLSLSYNSLNGTVEVEKFQSFSNLWKLELSYNNLSLDASITNSSLPIFPNLYHLHIASCNLYKFPAFIEQSNVTYLDLSNNKITGEIPSWIWEIGNRQLLYLNLSSNLLTDLEKPYHFPASLSMLDLHSNQLWGELPLLPTGALYLDYSNNNFEKSIPHDIVRFISSIFFLSLANNSLNGAIPTSFCNATYLQVLDLSNNNLSGGIPPCIVKNNYSLGVLNLGRNKISGNIPDAFPINCSLNTLDLSENNLLGNIPLSLANCKSLEVLNVGNNNINDSFPCTLSSKLHVLVLRSNRFHGEVRCYDSWPYLQIIDIASNPRSFLSWGGMKRDNGAQQRLNYLQFVFFVPDINYYQNKVRLTFKGLEMELAKILTAFTIIDFSCNNFKGEIPNAIGDPKSLYVLNFSHNNLIGKIPKSVGNLTQLGSLDLSMNQLMGKIPKELAELTFLEVLNLSYNKLVGMIPKGHQLQTFPATSSDGNTGLCGLPLNKSCNNTERSGSLPKFKNEQWHKKNEIHWKYVSAALGFVVGLGSYLWLLWGCQSLRQKIFDQIDNVLAKVFDPQDRRKRHGRRLVGN
ncbi:Leucine-rich repeat protein [Handroanthus impetiginosus]|uniref:Leucine-rich repeat protein n=1 Tax=Handroanthus impetiginosus TaxID=429701 RepID=A0A2G9H219_9LAMI|nr:Leucine-rich repeat protein [Handroanthus impetiginosus]